MDRLLLEEIISRYKHPQHRGHGGGQQFRAKNVSCGDEITLYLVIKNGVVESASFDGSLCSIANFGAELLIDGMIGRKVSDIKKITSCELLGDVELLKNPVRLKCFELAQVALSKM